MSEFNWASFTVRVDVKASKEELYMAWATRAGMERWFVRLSEYKNADGTLKGEDQTVTKGDTFRWLWHGWSDEMVENGEILDCNGKDLFKFSFGKAGNCTVRLKTEEVQNIVELVQDNIPESEKGMQYYHLGCKTGWTFYFANLKSLMEGGIDLRNRNVKLQNIISS